MERSSKGYVASDGGGCGLRFIEGDSPQKAPLIQLKKKGNKAKWVVDWVPIVGGLEGVSLSVHFLWVLSAGM